MNEWPGVRDDCLEAQLAEGLGSVHSDELLAEFDPHADEAAHGWEPSGENPETEIEADDDKTNVDYRDPNETETDGSGSEESDANETDAYGVALVDHDGQHDV